MIERQSRNWNLLFIIAFIMSFVMLGNIVDWLKQQEWYRDITQLTALYDFDTHSVKIEGKSAIIIGEFKKRRCDFLRGNYYVRGVHNVLLPALFESLTDPRTRIRPAVGEAQEFGPWKLTTYIDKPKDIVIYTTMSCPEGNFTVKLVDIPWENYEKESK